MYCRECGTMNESSAKFCKGCGRMISDNSSLPNEENRSLVKEVSQYNNENHDSVSNVSQDIPRVSKRNISLAIVFSLLTCGLFLIAWFFLIAADSNKLVEERKRVKPKLIVYGYILMGLSFLIGVFLSDAVPILGRLCILGIYVSFFMTTIYFYYCNYRIGKNLFEAGKVYNKRVSDYSVLYIIISILGMPFVVNLFMMQNDINLFGVEKGQ